MRNTPFYILECNITEVEFWRRTFIPRGSSWPWGKVGTSPYFFEIVGFSEILMFQSESFQTFAVGKDKSFEFYQKTFELGPLNLQVSQRPCVPILLLLAFQSVNLLLILRTWLLTSVYHVKLLRFI